MPTASGPFSLITRFHWLAISSKARSQETGWNSPSLWYSPSRMRSIGVFRRSWPYMILDRK